MSGKACDFNGVDEYCYKVNPLNLDLNGAEVLINPTFDVDVLNWNAWQATKAQETTIKRTGAGSLKLTLSSTIGGASSTVYATTDVQKWTGQAWFYVPAASSSKKVRISIETQAGASLAWVNKTVTADTWTKCVVNALAPGTQTSVHLSVYLYDCLPGDILVVDDASFSPGYDATVLSWFKADSVAGSRYLYSYSNAQGTYAIHLRISDSLLLAQSYDGTTVVNVETGFTDTTSFHLAAWVLDRTGYLTLYLDGISVGTPALATGLGKLIPSAAGYSDIRSIFGSRIFGAPALPFDGSIGETQIIRGAALTAAQVLDAYNGISATPPGGTCVAHYRWRGADDATFLSDETGNNNLTGTNVTQADDQVLGDYKSQVQLTGTIPSTSEFSGDVIRLRKCAGSIDSQSAATATIGRIRRMYGSIDASSAFDVNFALHRAVWYNRGPGLLKGDLVMTQRRDFAEDGSAFTIYRVFGEVIGVSTDPATGDEYADIHILEGEQYLADFGEDTEWVAIGSTTDPDRANLIYMTADEEYSPRIELRSGVDSIAKFGSMESLKHAIGNLAGITDANFGALTGFGDYGVNSYRKGFTAGGQATALSTGKGYWLSPEGDFRVGDMTANKFLRFTQATAVFDFGSAVAFQWSQVAGAGKPEDNATVGANWAANLANIPIRFAEAPSGTGLFITSTYMGYYASSTWKTYIASNGQWYFAGDANQFIAWDGATLSVKGTITVLGGNAVVTGGAAADVNAYSTKITAGKILISGATTLADWEHGSDATKIDGGKIYTGSITVLGAVTSGSIVVGTTNKMWFNEGADGVLAIGGSTKATAPFRVTAAGAVTSTMFTLEGGSGIATLQSDSGLLFNDTDAPATMTKTYSGGVTGTFSGGTSWYFQSATGNGYARALQLYVATGTAPMTIASTTVVANLNADLLDGYHASAFLTSLPTHGNEAHSATFITVSALSGYATESWVTIYFDPAGTASGLMSSHNSAYNHANIAHGETAYGWGNHASAGYATTTWVTNQGYWNSANIASWKENVLDATYSPLGHTHSSLTGNYTGSIDTGSAIVQVSNGVITGVV